jgi:prepilin-type N-terminal cleavage/methylation domain-containing protein
MKIFKARKGFTLIELMIVVAIIGILAAVAIPKFAQMMEKAKEGATKGNIGAIKSALSIYYGDQQGNWPWQITDSLFANYLKVPVPAVKITHPKSMFPSGTPLSGTCATVAMINSGSGGETYAATGDGWLYNQATGNVFVNNNQTDTSGTGTVYTMFGYQ